jgi:uncharacterized membrane protein YfcA
MEFEFLLIALIAEVVGTVAGFGSSTIALPLSLFIFDFHTALTLVAFLHIFGNAAKLYFFRQGLDTGLLVKFGVPSVIFTIVGALLVTHLPEATLEALLGGLLVIYAVASWLHSIKLKPTQLTAFAGGAVSGFFAGLLGTGGAMRAAFLNVYHLPKEKFIATTAAVAVIADSMRLPIYLYDGFLDQSLYWLLPIMIVIAVLGTYIGKLIVTKLPQKHFRQIVLIAIFLAGIHFMYGALV